MPEVFDRVELRRFRWEWQNGDVFGHAESIGHTRLVVLQDADNLFFCEMVALHSLVLSMGQSLLQNGLIQRGKVTSPSKSVRSEIPDRIADLRFAPEI